MTKSLSLITLTIIPSCMCKERMDRMLTLSTARQYNNNAEHNTDNLCIQKLSMHEVKLRQGMGLEGEGGG